MGSWRIFKQWTNQTNECWYCVCLMNLFHTIDKKLSNEKLVHTFLDSRNFLIIGWNLQTMMQNWKRESSGTSLICFQEKITNLSIYLISFNLRFSLLFTCKNLCVVSVETKIAAAPFRRTEYEFSPDSKSCLQRIFLNSKLRKHVEDLKENEES